MKHGKNLEIVVTSWLEDLIESRLNGKRPIEYGGKLEI
jgi:hypothetical protein